MKIPEHSIVRVKEMGNIIEILYSEKHPTICSIVKLDKDHYCDKRTGEVLEFKHTENRSQNLKSVAKSLGKGRDLLNANITDVSKCRWVTFTYAENMTDPERLRANFRDCNKRLRKIYGHYEFITAAEPQARGAWHLHAVFIFKDKAPFMDNEVVAKAWKQGFVSIKSLDDVDNVGAYLTAYLGDMELSEFDKEFPTRIAKEVKTVEIEDDTGQKQTKKYVKGGRLYMYPPQFHIFRSSKGIKKPVVTRQSYKQAKEKVNLAKLTYQKSIVLADEETDFENMLSYEHYNTIRK